MTERVKQKGETGRRDFEKIRKRVGCPTRYGGSGKLGGKEESEFVPGESLRGIVPPTETSAIVGGGQGVSSKTNCSWAQGDLLGRALDAIFWDTGTLLFC